MTLVSKRRLEGLKDLKKVRTSQENVVGIGDIPQQIQGAVLLDIEIGDKILTLKCLVLEDMKYDIVLGRDMLDLWMLGINYTKSMIYFRSEEQFRNYVRFFCFF